ncbi:26S proteasome non-ATPase regulatory subunit 9-like protein [Umbelopsis sp. PMI_123]|nr:26S proteasome non-ATPase regulatory subunit 9-like protein [Umbelopsis sp. PMI_123]
MGLQIANMAQSSSAMENAKALIAKKDSIEAEIRELQATLQTQGVGMDQPLVDREGFPRSDIDVVAVRTARHTIIELTNDHKQLMKEIEQAILSLHQGNKPNPAQQSSNNTSSTRTPHVASEPFARVNAVAPDSAAKEAGLIKEDHIIRFGSIHAGNHRMLQALNEVVAQGRQVEIVVKRNDETITLSLMPKRVGSRYTIGCHLLPL